MGLLDVLRGSNGDEAAATTAEDVTAPDSGGEGRARLAAVAAKARKGGRRAAQLADELRQQQQAAQLDELFEGENWTEVASLYFDARFAITGDTCFELPPNKRKVLGVTMAKAMKVLTAIDPAYLALGLFVVHFGGTVAQCEMVHAQHEAAKRAKDRDRAAPVHGIP